MKKQPVGTGLAAAASAFVSWPRAFPPPFLPLQVPAYRRRLTTRAVKVPSSESCLPVSVMTGVSPGTRTSMGMGTIVAR